MEPKNNYVSNPDDFMNDYETKKFVQNKFSVGQKQLKNQMQNKKQKLIFIPIIIIFLIIIFIILIKIKNSKNNSINQENKIKIIEQKKNDDIIPFNNLSNTNDYSTKWVVLTTIRYPNKNIKRLLEIPKPWKIVVIGDIRTKNESWDIYKNSTKLKYLSLEDQMKLGYNIIKYNPFNSYSRKNIGYLYAIQHGAKEIYETDDNYYITNLLSLNNQKSDYIFYAENDNKVMVNPYSFYGKSTVWPRGYRLKDLDKNSDTKFYRLLSRRAELNHLIYQGLINIDPDVDSIYLQTRSSKNLPTNQSFYFSGNLMYLPGNFIPINSKNTKYLYDVFPALPLPTIVSKRVMDIWRGYLMQRYEWFIMVP